MKKTAWINRIREACVNAGTYRDYFDDTIDALAQILARRDDIDDIYKKSGAMPTIQGARGEAKNPTLAMWDEMNKVALAYWRDLGLTPKGLKSIDENSMKPQKLNKLAEVLKNFD